MDESLRTALLIEAIFYESVVNGLVEDYADGLAAGKCREELLFAITASLLSEVSTREQLSSLAAMLVCVLAEERAAV